MQAGDVILFIGQDDFIDEAIEFVTESKYTHAALAISETEFVEAWWNGVRKDTFDGRGEYDIFTPITPLTEEEKDMMTGFGLGKVGEEYDFLQLFGFPIEKMLHLDKNVLGSKHSVICSQLVYQAYKAIGIDLTPGVEEYSVSPATLSMSKLLAKVER